MLTEGLGWEVVIRKGQFAQGEASSSCLHMLLIRFTCTVAGSAVDPLEDHCIHLFVTENTECCDQSATNLVKSLQKVFFT